jgi:hypothetical protein
MLSLPFITVADPRSGFFLNPGSGI